MRTIFATLLVAAAVILASAATSTADLALRARRFFNQGDWAGASAMYSLLIDARPDSIPLYGEAITAAGMRGAENEQIELLRRALHARIPVDSVFKAVERTSFSLGQTDLLERFLKLSAQSEPWLSRKIDASLLEYYTFRRDGAAMLSQADALIPGMPDNETFLLRRAEALLLLGRTAESVSAFETALDVNPQSLTALLYLGELNLAGGDTAAARQYLSRAAAIDLTPRLAATLKRIK